MSQRRGEGTHAPFPEDGFRILFIGDIVGSPGVWCIKKGLPILRKEMGINMVIANADAATGGFGLGKNHAIYLHKLGIDVITSGECIYYKKDMVPHLEHARYILRPVNYPEGNPGQGWVIYRKDDWAVAVVNILGQSGFDRVHLSNPFLFLSEFLKDIRQETSQIVVDFHATTTAEKVAMAHHLDGQISALIGTHSKVQTADERIMPGGTAAITGAGRTGSAFSVGGLDQAVEIRKFLTQIPERSQASWQVLELQGVFLQIGSDGRAESIERVCWACEEIPDDRKRNSQRNQGEPGSPAVLQ